jgi:hypothetical protein
LEGMSVIVGVGFGRNGRGGDGPQAQLSVASGVRVPVGERGHPALQPRALDNEVGDRGLRHDCGV